jgi:hypothetical protein
VPIDAALAAIMSCTASLRGSEVNICMPACMVSPTKCVGPLLRFSNAAAALDHRRSEVVTQLHGDGAVPLNHGLGRRHRVGQKRLEVGSAPAQ